MATENVLINFEVDYSELTNAQEQLAKTGKIDDKGFQKIQAAINTTATDTKGLIKTFKDVAGASVKMGKTVEDAFGAGIQDALDEAGVSLKEFETTLKKANAPAITLKKELQQLKESMARMKAEGKDTGKEFDSLRQRAGKLSDAIADANSEIKNAGSDTRGIDNVVGSISALTGGYAAVQGAAALFGEESEDLQRALLKVNGAMALASGLQQTLNALQKEGALTKLADSVATGAQSAAQRIYAVAVGTSTGAMKAFRIALLATGIGAVIALLALAANAMGLFGDETDDGKLSTDDFNKALEKQNRLLDQNITALETAGKLAATRRSGGDGPMGEALEEIRIQKRKLEILRDAELQARKDQVRNNQMANQEATDNIKRLVEQVQAQQDLIKQLEVQAIADQEKREKDASDKRIANLKAAGLKLKAERDKIIQEEERQANVADQNRITRALAAVNKELEQEYIAFENKADIDAQLYAEKKKNAEDWDTQWKAFQASLVKSSEDAAAKIKAEEDAAMAQRIKNAQIAIQIGDQLVGIFSQIASAQTERDNQLIASKRKVVEEELRAGVITQKAALAKLARLEQAEKEARYRAAKREKQAAMFSAALAVPKAFLQGLSQGGLPLAIVYAALAAIEFALVASRPVPRFFMGKKNRYEGPGEVADMGSEIVERDGRMYLYTKPTKTYLGANDKVYTASETRNIMHNTKVNTTVRQVPRETFDYDRLAKAIPVSTQVVNIDKDFISESVANGLSRVNYMDRRYSSRK